MYTLIVTYKSGEVTTFSRRPLNELLTLRDCFKENVYVKSYQIV